MPSGQIHELTRQFNALDFARGRPSAKGINAALNAAWNEGGGEVILPPTNWVIDDLLWIKAGSVRLRGIGMPKLILDSGMNCPAIIVIPVSTSGSPSNPLYADMIDWIEIAGLEIDCNGTNQVRNSASVFTDPFGIRVRACRNVNLHHLYVHDSRQTGIAVERSADCRVCDSTIYNIGLNPDLGPRNGACSYDGVPGEIADPFPLSRRMTFDRLTVIGFPDGGIGHASNGAGGTVVISNSHVQGVGGQFTAATAGDLGIGLESGQSPYTSPAPQMISVVGGTITDCQTGIGIRSSDSNPATPRYDELYDMVTVSGVQIRRVQRNGVHASGRQIQIQGVNVKDYGMDLTSNAYGLLFDGGYVPVDDGIAQTHLLVNGFTAKAYPGATTSERSGVALYNGGVGSGENIDLSHLELEGGGTAQECAAYSGGIMVLGDWRKVRISHFGITGHRHGVSIRNANADLSVADGHVYRNNEAGVYLIGSGAGLVAPTFDNVKCIDNGQDSGTTQRVGFYLRSVINPVLRNCVATNRDGTTQQYGLNTYLSTVSGGRVEGGDLSGNAVAVYNSITGFDLFRGVKGINPVGPLTAPAVPTSGVPLLNPFPYDCAVDIGGGTITAIAKGPIGSTSYYFTGKGLEVAGAGGADIWQDWTEAVTDGALADDTVVFHSGAHAAKITAGVLKTTRVEIFSKTVVPGQSYKLTWWAYGDGSNALRYTIYDSTNAADIKAIGSCGQTAAAWAQITDVVVAPAGCTTIALYIWCPDLNTAFGYADDAELVDMPRATGLTSGEFALPAGEWLTLTYSVAPTVWQWFGA